MSETVDNYPTQDPSWQLDSIFEGGWESEAFDRFVKAIERDTAELKAQVGELVPLWSSTEITEAALTDWVGVLLGLEKLWAKLREATSYAQCLAVTHTDEPKALRLPARLNRPQAEAGELVVAIKARLQDAKDKAFDRLVVHDKLERAALYLRELRRDADRMMEPELEELAVQLNADGLHGWGQLYDRVSSTLRVSIDTGDGEPREVSVGQAKTLLDDPDADVRKAAYDGMQAAWRSRQTTFAAALNGIVGTQRTLYTRRGGDELTEPLLNNRVERATVEAMFEAAADFRDDLTRYMHAKAKLLGVERLAWWDRMAPVGQTNDDKLGYEEAQRFIVDQVADFSPRMADFYKELFARQWAEVEDRPGKSQGGFCTGFPVSKQIRIFLTFAGTSSGLATLAHELGHAYHGWLMRDLGYFETRIPSGLAETASTLSEALVESAALERAEGRARLRILDERLQRASAFLVNIPARFDLERALHARRAEAELDEDWLCAKTTEIFERHYGESVSGVDPTYWASKLHFYIAGYPFYNFPYTFGYLFSRAVWQRAEAEGPAYAKVVDELLEDTGRLTSEEIGRRYLDADLTDADFWRQAAASTRDDVERFVALADEHS